MLHLSTQVRYFLYNGVVDMRKGCYGLCGLVNNELNLNVYSGDIFVFIGKRKNKLKLLQWDKDGFALYEKHLIKGCFEHPSQDHTQSILLSSLQLQHILSGVIIKQAVYKKRFAKTA
jgi:transposase